LNNSSVVKKIVSFLSCCCFILAIHAQTETDVQLAQYYYLNGEFSKALVYYEGLYSSTPSKVYFSRYLDCLVNTGDKKGAEKLFKKQISSNPTDVLLKIQCYFFYKGIEEEDKAKKVKNEILKQDFFDPKEIEDILDNLLAIDEFEWAVDFIDKAKKNVKFYPYELWYAKICTAKGEKIKALDYYLEALSRRSSLKEQIQLEIGAAFDFSTDTEELKQVKNSFLVAGQKDPSNTVFAEMLIWFFMQSKNFPAAYQQCLAYEKRTQGDGKYLIDFATSCLENNEYELALKALNEVISQNLSLKIEAQQWKLSTYFKQVTSFRKFTAEEMNAIIADYEAFLSNKDILRYGSDRIVLEYAEILGFYANQAPKAKKFLEEKVVENGLTDMQRAKIKLKLADVCVIMDSIWDASLLYMQINDDFKFEPIGNEAKFKNARIFYFDGEFEYAQSQLDVLKQATSRFISNDAIQLSLLILENYGLDSNYEAMSSYAKSELLLLQRRYSEAFQWMDSISIKFPQSVLNDDILYLKGKANMQQGAYDQAMNYFQRLLSTYPTELLADDALFDMATIQEIQLKDTKAATESYLKIIDQYPGSVYTEETRLRIRRLRGDVVPD